MAKKISNLICKNKAKYILITFLSKIFRRKEIIFVFLNRVDKKQQHIKNFND